jgi:ligand-binding sensor domain-containing protein
MYIRYLIFICLLTSLSASAVEIRQTLPSAQQQNDHYRFRTLSPEGGFYYDGVKSVLQDHDGFVWILMENNLYRFDGYQYKSYYQRFATLKPEKGYLFINIDIDSSGKFYVNTSNGLYVYDKISDNFHFIWENVDLLRIDAADNLWIRRNSQWRILDINKQTTYTPLYDGDSLSYISSLFCLNNDDLYLFSNYGKIYRFNEAKKEFLKRIPLKKSYLSVLSYQLKEFRIQISH